MYFKNKLAHKYILNSDNMIDQQKEKGQWRHLSKSSWVCASLANLWITPWSVITFGFTYCTTVLGTFQNSSAERVPSECS